MAKRGDGQGAPACSLLLLLLNISLHFAAVHMETDIGHGYKEPLPPPDPRSHMKGSLSHLNRDQKIRFPPPAFDLTTRLPEFLPDGPRPFIPDPSFMPSDKEVIAHVGDSATLPCTVQNLGTKQISWRKVGGKHFLSIGTDIWVQDPNMDIKHQTWPAGVSDWNLEFREARLADSGEYECEIIATEKMIWTVHFTVIELPPHKPAISIEGRKFVESGQSVYLRCNTTEGNRIPDSVEWFKNGDKIDTETYPRIMITRFRHREDMTLVSELMINSGRRKDSGTYVCRSSSSLIAHVEVSVLVADSTNVKRAGSTDFKSGHKNPNTDYKDNMFDESDSGSSKTQTGGQTNGESSAKFDSAALCTRQITLCVVLLIWHLMKQFLLT